MSNDANGEIPTLKYQVYYLVCGSWEGDLTAVCETSCKCNVLNIFPIFEPAQANISSEDNIVFHVDCAWGAWWDIFHISLKTYELQLVLLSCPVVLCRVVNLQLSRAQNHSITGLIWNTYELQLVLLSL